MKESSILKACMHELESRGAYFFKTHGTAFGRRGVPDIAGTYKGRSVYVETKTPTGRLTTSQKLEAKRIRLAGGVWILARAREDVAFALDEIDARPS